MEDFDGNTAYAAYDGFRISSEEDGYRLLSASNYTGDAGDSLGGGINWSFSTPGRDQDGWPEGSCAERNQGAWWYWRCGWSNLNSRYLEGKGDGDWIERESLVLVEVPAVSKASRDEDEARLSVSSSTARGTG